MKTNLRIQSDDFAKGRSLSQEVRRPSPLKYGTTLQEALAYQAHSPAQAEFIEKRIQEQEEKMMFLERGLKPFDVKPISVNLLNREEKMMLLERGLKQWIRS